MAATPESWTLDHLQVHLQAAVELELLVIPPYLSALYSLEPGSNHEAALIIRSVVVEEMLHLTLAANVLNAVGGNPTVNNPAWVPRYPAKIPYHEGTLAVSLRPFGDEALDAFLAIENPSYAAANPPPPPGGAATPRLLTLDECSYPTVGAFYHAIECGLKGLVARHGESPVFTGDPGCQVGPEHYYGAGGRAIEVTSLETALEALDVIVEQGEGELTLPPSGEKFDEDRDLAHFYRFNELRQRRRYLANDEPDRPTGSAIEIEAKAIYPFRVDLRREEIPDGELRVAVEANCGIWTRLLDQIQAGISGSPEALQEAVATMFELKYSSQQLLRIPLPDGKGEHAGPTFQYLHPDRSTATSGGSFRPGPASL
jgi:hypothetical protein